MTFKRDSRPGGAGKRGAQTLCSITERRAGAQRPAWPVGLGFFPSSACGRGQGEGAFAVSFRCSAGPTSSRTPTHVPVFSARFLRAGNFLLRAQEKVTKEKGTPSGPVSGLLPADCAIGLWGSLTVHPWTATNARASCARPFGLILHPLAGPQGDPGGRAARSCAQKHRGFRRSHRRQLAPTKRRSPCGSGGSRDALAFTCSCFALLVSLLCFCFCAHDARCSFGSPSAPVDGGREGPQGRAHDARAFAVSARMRCRRTPAGVHAPAGQDARRAVLSGCPFSW